MRKRDFVLLGARMCERAERKPALVEYKGHISQTGNSKPRKLVLI